jgi:hypothetical protein
VLDIDTYITDLELANQNDTQSPEYFVLYNSIVDLEMENLFPEQWDNLARRLVVDDALYEKFAR